MHIQLFFSCTVIQINPVTSLINGFFFSLVRSCGLFSFLNMFSTIRALHFKRMHPVCLFRITKKVSPLQPVFRFRVFSCKINFIKTGLLVQPHTPIRPAGLCATLVYAGQVTQLGMAALPCLYRGIITGSFPAVPSTEQHSSNSTKFQLMDFRRHWSPCALVGKAVFFHKCFLISCHFFFTFTIF